MMSDFYKRLIQYKEDESLTNSDLGRLISVSGDTFRMGIKRESFSDIRIKKLTAIMDGEHSSYADTDLFLEKDNVKVSVDEMIVFFILNIKKIKNVGKLDRLIEAINSVENIDKYNNLINEIDKIKKLLDKNKDVLKL